MDFDHYLIIDFEATCCDRVSVARSEMEIIEIGAVMVRTSDLASAGEFQSFVRPVRHPQLTPFCIGLTSISQAQVDCSAGFTAVIAALRSWLAPFGRSVFCSWGDYDLMQLRQDCAFHEAPYPIAGPHWNVKRMMAEAQSLKKSRAWARPSRWRA